jgi:hypothetical protein
MQQSWAGQSKPHSEIKATAAHLDMSLFFGVIFVSGSIFTEPIRSVSNPDPKYFSFFINVIGFFAEKSNDLLFSQEEQRWCYRDS